MKKATNGRAVTDDSGGKTTKWNMADNKSKKIPLIYY